MGCATETKSPFDISYDNYILGEASLGNTVLAVFNLEPAEDYTGNIFYSIEWKNTTFGSIEYNERTSKYIDPGFHEATDLFEIDRAGMKITEEFNGREKKVRISVPVKILREGSGAITVHCSYENSGFGFGLDINTTGYVAPEVPDTDPHGVVEVPQLN